MKEEEPVPIQTVTARAGCLTLIVRKWDNEDGRSCRRCSDCTFQPGEDNTGLCIVGTNEPVPHGTAWTYGDMP